MTVQSIGIQMRFLPFVPFVQCCYLSYLINSYNRSSPPTWIEYLDSCLLPISGSGAVQHVLLVPAVQGGGAGAHRGGETLGRQVGRQTNIRKIRNSNMN